MARDNEFYEEDGQDDGDHWQQGNPQYLQGYSVGSQEGYNSGFEAGRKSGRFWRGVSRIVIVILAAGAVGYDYVAERGDHIASVGRFLEGTQSHPGRASDVFPSAKPTQSASSSSSLIEQPSKTPSPKPTKKAPRVKVPLVVLDPGHDGRTHSTIDTRTGLEDQGYLNVPETGEMFDVTLAVQKQLTVDGYRVLVTKKFARDVKTFRERADMAIKNRAALEVSIHDDHGQGPDFQAVYPQFVGGYRGGGEHAKVVCNNPKVAAKSLHFAQAIARARTEAQGHKVTIQTNDFNNRTGLEPGNLSIVQLFACQGDPNGKHAVPEVYNEMGALTGGNVHQPASRMALRNYTTGLVNGIEAAVPIKHTIQ